MTRTRSWSFVAGAWVALAACVATMGCASSSPPPANATGATHVAIPEWVEGGAPHGTTNATTLEAPTAKPPLADAFATKTIGVEGASKPKWSGRAIDLDVKDADIHDVCRLLAEVGKTNIVVADDVHGSVTIKMKHVPWDQALEAILRAKGFDSLRDGNIILVVTGK
jgi:type IV pilus assembly protein PilQ